MTSASSFERGWNKTNEPGLRVYVAADGTTTGYFKGRINGKVSSVRLDGFTLTEWKRECRILRGDEERAEQKAGNRRVTVAAFAETYLARQQERIGHPNTKLRRSRRSVELDQQRLRKFVVDSKLGRMKIADVRVEHLREHVAGLYKLRLPSGEPYAQNTLRDVLRLLGAIFREARKDNLITRNHMLEFPSDERPSSELKREKRYLDPGQVDALLVGLGETFQPIVTVCAWAGLRIAETLGLVWGNLDLDAGTMTITHQLDRGPEGELVDTKTKNSKATLDLLPEVVEALKAHKRTMRERGIHYVAKDALVFVTATGEPQNERNVLRAVHRVSDELGFNVEGGKKVDIHSLRHSFISNAIDVGGLTIPEVALLARQDPGTTQDTYAKVVESKRREAASKLAVALGR